MISTKKTRVLRISVRQNKESKREAVLYVQPDGLLVFRWLRGRKRYGISVEEAFTRAMRMGPIEGLIAGLLDKKTRQKEGKHAKTGGNGAAENPRQE